MAIWASAAAACVLAVAWMPTPMHWGGRHGGTQAPMSRLGRVVFVTFVALMLGVILAGVSQFPHLEAVIAAFLISVLTTLVVAALDTHRWRKRSGPYL